MNVDIPCPCPPKASGEPRHDHDTVTFADKLGLEAGLSIRKAVTITKVEDPGSGAAEVLAAMSVQYIVHGISAWTLTDDKGKRIEPDKIAIRKFIEEHDDIVADYLVDPADDLYSERHLAPLLKRGRDSSQPSPTEPSISAAIGSGETPRKPSRRSSTSTTRTEGTGTITTLPVGGSSTSRKSASA